MGRQCEQMTLNNPDILFIHLFAAWKDEISGKKISYVESTMHFEYLSLFFYSSFLLHDVLMKKSIFR